MQQEISSQEMVIRFGLMVVVFIAFSFYYYWRYGLNFSFETNQLILIPIWVGAFFALLYGAFVLKDQIL